MMSRDAYEHWEERLSAQHRKESKKERKLASAKDRSKFKKSDQDQLKKKATQIPAEPEIEALPLGRVLSVLGQDILVEQAGKEFLCSLRGVLKKEKQPLKSLVTVGDLVRFLPDGPSGVIVRVEPRTSHLSRENPNNPRQAQLIAANVDQVLITFSLLMPQLRPLLADRYIIAAHKGHMQPILVVNKVDLLRTPPRSLTAAIVQEEKELFEEFVATYQQLGFQVLTVSATTGEGLEALRLAMRDKVSVFSGQSGVGKSSLINAMLGSDLPTGEVREDIRKGIHTTTTAQLLPLAWGGWCIDTPGLRLFGVGEIALHEIHTYFPEIAQIARHCKYPNCTHTHEPHCAVRTAAEKGEIARLRFLSYQKLVQNQPLE